MWGENWLWADDNENDDNQIFKITLISLQEQKISIKNLI